MNKGLREKLDSLIQSEEFKLIDGNKVRIISWSLDGISVVLSVIDDTNKEDKIILDMDELLSQIGAGTTNNKYNLHHLRNKLIDNIDKIESGDLDTIKAKEISNSIQKVINLTKLELEYRRSIGREIIDDDIKFLESGK